MMPDVIEVMMWLNMSVCLPLTTLIIYCVCCVVRRSPVPVIYYTNLLISNLIQICRMIVWILGIRSSIANPIYYSCVMASLHFKLCIALERYFSIRYALLDFLKETRSSVLDCVLVWAFCIVSVPLAFVLREFVRFIIYAVLNGLMFMFCSARTFSDLPDATLLPTEEKHRSLGILILLFFNYLLILLLTIICLILGSPSIGLFLILLSPFVDLILFLFMQKQRISKLLECQSK